MEYSYEIIEALFDKYGDSTDKDNLYMLAKILSELYMFTECDEYRTEFINLCELYNLKPVFFGNKVVVE